MDNLQYVDKVMDLSEPNRDQYQMTIHNICTTEILIDNEPCIKAILQIGIDNRYHFVCKNEHECQVQRLIDDSFDCFGDHFDNTEHLHVVTDCDKSP